MARPIGLPSDDLSDSGSYCCRVRSMMLSPEKTFHELETAGIEFHYPPLHYRGGSPWGEEQAYLP